MSGRGARAGSPAVDRELTPPDQVHDLGARVVLVERSGDHARATPPESVDLRRRPAPVALVPCLLLSHADPPLAPLVAAWMHGDAAEGHVRILWAWTPRPPSPAARRHRRRVAI